MRRSRAFLLAIALAVVPALAQAQARSRGVVDIDVVGADIADVLRLIAGVGHVNLVYGGDVTGNVTVRLRGVRWLRALDVVLAAKGLAAEREGNVIRVAPAATFARERAARLEAHASCIALAPLETRLIPVSYAQASDLVALIRARLSSRGTVAIDERTNTLIVTDIVGCD